MTMAGRKPVTMNGRVVGHTTGIEEMPDGSIVIEMEVTDAEAMRLLGSGAFDYVSDPRAKMG